MQIDPYSAPLPIRPANVFYGLLCTPHVSQPGQESLPDSLHFLHAAALAPANPLDECPDAHCRGNGVTPSARWDGFVLPHLDLDEGFDGWLGDGLARLNHRPVTHSCRSGVIVVIVVVAGGGGVGAGIVLLSLMMGLLGREAICNDR